MTQPTLSDWLARKREGKKKRPPIPRVSGKRAVQLREYRGIRKVYLTDHPFCEFPSCQSTATEIHHKKRRVGAMLNKTNHFMAICSEHHRWLHNKPREARHMGLLA
jgi:hypothetical protein